MCPTVPLPLGRKREPHTLVPDVQGRVHVAVMGASARGARPLPHRQVLGPREAVAALVTELARRKQPADGDEPLAPVFEFVAEKGAEHAEAVIHRGLAELQAPGHAPHVKILHAHAVVALHESVRRLVVEVLPLVFHLLVDACDPELLLSPVGGTLLHPGELSLLTCELPFGMSEVSRVSRALAVARDVEVVAGVVEADERLGFDLLGFLGFELEQDGYLEPAGPRVLDRCALDPPRRVDFPLLAHAHASELRQAQVAPVTLEADVAVHEVGLVAAAAPVLCLVPREPRLLAGLHAVEEVPIGRIEVQLGVAEREAVHLAEPGELPLVFCRGDP